MKYSIFATLMFGLLAMSSCGDMGKISKKSQKQIDFYKAQNRDSRIIGIWLAYCEKNQNGKLILSPSHNDKTPFGSYYMETGEIARVTVEYDPDTKEILKCTPGSPSEWEFYYTTEDMYLHRLQVEGGNGLLYKNSERLNLYKIIGDELQIWYDVDKNGAEGSPGSVYLKYTRE